MNRLNFLRLLLALVATVGIVQICVAQTATDPNEGSRLSLDTATSGYDFSWWGNSGRTYFIQQTDDLLTSWSYLPVIESGANDVLQWGFTSTNEKFFLRLRFSDIPTSDPFNDNFDGDKVSNYAELLNGTDPLHTADTDGDGIPDDWEIAHGLNPSDPAMRAWISITMDSQTSKNTPQEPIQMITSTAQAPHRRRYKPKSCHLVPLDFRGVEERHMQ